MARARSKNEVRRDMRARRNALSSAEQQLAARQLAQQLAGTRLFRVSRRIACYLPDDGEIDPGIAVERLRAMKKQVYLPVLSRLAHEQLWFAPAAPDGSFAPNRFGIPEPRVPARRLLRAQQLDLVLLPLVAFDARGNRLGRGAGFYDRSLAFRRHRRFLAKPHVLGLAHDLQRVDALPTDAWDVPLDGIVTDRAVYLADT